MKLFQTLTLNINTKSMDTQKVKYTDRIYGEQIREFSRAVHGDNFLEIAKEFAATNQGELVDENTVIPPKEELTPEEEADKKRVIGDMGIKVKKKE